MKKYKTTHRMYSAWNYQREIDDLNLASENGWQLLEGRLFSSRFVRNEDVRYRYQLDYQPNIEDRARYIESFREFGWQYINSTINGWHYFRKPYDPSLPEEEYEIFSDRSSLKEMNGRWAKLAVGLAVFGSLVAIIELAFMILRPTLPTLALLVSYVILNVFLIRGIIIMKNPEKSKSSKGDLVLTSLFLTMIFCGLALGCTLNAMRPYFECSMFADEMNAIPAGLEEAVQWNTLTINYTDNYYLDVAIDADSPITLSLVDASGDEVYSITEASVDSEDIRLRLDRGEYRILLSDFAGGRLEASIDI